MEAAAYHARVIAAFTKWAQGDESQDKLPSVLRDGVATVMHQQRDALAAKDAEILRLKEYGLRWTRLKMEAAEGERPLIEGSAKGWMLEFMSSMIEAFFVEHKGENFVTQDARLQIKGTGKVIGDFTVTIQRQEGLTPAQLLNRERAVILRLRAALEQIANAAINGEFTECNRSDFRSGAMRIAIDIARAALAPVPPGTSAEAAQRSQP